MNARNYFIFDLLYGMKNRNTLYPFSNFLPVTILCNMRVDNKKWLQINIKTIAFVVDAFLTKYYIIHFMWIILQFTPCHIIDSSHISCFSLRCSRLTLFYPTFSEFKLEIAHVCFWWLYYSIWNCWNNNNLRGQFNMF